MEVGALVKLFFIKQFEYLIKNIDKFTDNKIFIESNKEIFRNLKENNLVVYYNAWQNDDHEAPLESIMYWILNEFPNQKKQLNSFQEYKKIVKGFIRDVIKVASLETIDIKHFDEMKSYSDITSSIITNEEKKVSFNKLVDDILTDNQRLILIVDELDRCKPTFAVRLLENLKHFYNNSKITIIVVTNNNELSHTIRNYYGYGFDGYGYLNKFYDAIITLECNNLKEYLQKRFEFCNRTWLPHDFCYVILNYYKFTLRECNKFITIYNLLKNYIENDDSFNKYKNYIFSDLFLPLAVALKIKKIDLFQAFMSDNGEEIILNIIKAFRKESSMKDWIHEIIINTNPNNKSDEDIIVEYYHELFSVNEFSNKFYDAISLLGSKINLDND